MGIYIFNFIIRAQTQNNARYSIPPNMEEALNENNISKINTLLIKIILINKF